MRLQGFVVVLLTALLTASCGRVVPAGGEVTHPESEVPKELIATDLIPADLDLVVRVDLAQIRESLGSETSELLSTETLGKVGPEGIVQESLRSADTVWLGLRVSDITKGDRVLVVESRQRTTAPDPIAWRRLDSAPAEATVYEALVPPPRHGTAQIILIGERSTVFVSPVQVASVDRVMANGGDDERGQPTAQGLISLDYRGGRVSVPFENAYPSLASLVSSISRIKATVELTGGDLKLDGRVRCHTDRDAERLTRVLSTFIESGKHLSGPASLLGSLEMEQEDSIVTLRWPLPPKVVLALLRDPEALVSGEQVPAQTPRPPSEESGPRPPESAPAD